MINGKESVKDIIKNMRKKSTLTFWMTNQEW